MYDLCERVESVRSHHDKAVLFPRTKRKQAASGVAGRYEFLDQAFTVGKLVAKGASGRIYEGTFGVRPVVVKVNVGVPVEEDVNEALMQTRLYCHLRDRKGGIPPGAARIPETVFAATVTGVGRVLGMAKVGTPLLADVQGRRSSSEQVGALRKALTQVAKLLVVLQDDVSFVHGDLHGENVMIQGDGAFLIDFGMSSARFGRNPRMVTNDRYAGVRFHRHLDLLTLLTSLREDLALKHCTAAASWCDARVRPFWDTVRGGLFAGSRRALKYGAQKTVRTARAEIESSGEIYYAHHLLYEEIGRVSYPPCDPRVFLRSHPSTAKADLSLERIFEDV